MSEDNSIPNTIMHDHGFKHDENDPKIPIEDFAGLSGKDLYHNAVVFYYPSDMLYIITDETITEMPDFAELIESGKISHMGDFLYQSDAPYNEGESDE